MDKGVGEGGPKNWTIFMGVIYVSSLNSRKQLFRLREASRIRLGRDKFYLIYKNNYIFHDCFGETTISERIISISTYTKLVAVLDIISNVLFVFDRILAEYYDLLYFEVCSMIALTGVILTLC